MGKFLQSEKPKQVHFKNSSKSISENAKPDGLYKGHYYPFCLPQDCAEQNLFPEIRGPIVHYFRKKKIKWHDGHNEKPSNHMCDSQVCCSNFLFPFYDKPKALASLLTPIFPNLKHMLPIENDQFVSFEWIGKDNYLHEKISRNGKRTRGANFTSADAAVMFDDGGQVHIALIEWKYTESYYPTSLKIAPSQTDRTEIYRHLYDSLDCPLDKTKLMSFDNLFFEPFYQLMRQQFLVTEMEKAHELGADIVSLLHVAPRKNLDFLRVTSKDIKYLGHSPTEIWKKLVKNPDRFQSVFTEDLLGNFQANEFPELKDWWKYITARYSWVKEKLENPVK
jgi:hypothetical protein